MYFLLGLGTVTVTAYDGFFTFLTFIDEIRCGRTYPLAKRKRIHWLKESVHLQKNANKIIFEQIVY